MAHNINLKEPNYETVMCNFEEIEPIFLMFQCYWQGFAKNSLMYPLICMKYSYQLVKQCELARINCFPIARRGGARFSFSVQSLPTYTCKQGFCRSVFHLDTVYKDTFLALVVRLDNTFGTIPYSLVQYTV